MKFPFYHQPNSMDCGPTCLRMVAKHYGRQIFMEYLRTHSEYGKEVVSMLGLAKEKEYEEFAAKYPMNGELKQQEEKIDKMSQWCMDTDIRFTPTIFINGKQMPDAYSIGDLQYFLLD